MDLESGGRFEIPSAADEWMNLAEPSCLAAGEKHSCRPTRMQEGMRLRLELEGCTQLLRQRLQDALEREEVARPLTRPPARLGEWARGPGRPPRPPAGRGEWARGQGRDAVRLEGGRGALAGELAAKHAARRRCAPG